MDLKHYASLKASQYAPKTSKYAPIVYRVFLVGLWWFVLHWISHIIVANSQPDAQTTIQGIYAISYIVGFIGASAFVFVANLVCHWIFEGELPDWFW